MSLLDHPDLIDRARADGGRIILATGALLGFDAVRAAAEGEVHSVRMVTRKPPRSLKTAKYVVENKIELDGLGWTIAGKIDSRNARGYCVTDGAINIALLNFKNRPTAGMEFAEGYAGLHHLGFQCDDIEAVVDRFESSGFAPRHDVNIAQDLGMNPDKDNAEYKMTGPEGVMIDVSERGWAGTDTYKGKPPA